MGSRRREPIAGAGGSIALIGFFRHREDGPLERPAPLRDNSKLEHCRSRSDPPPEIRARPTAGPHGLVRDESGGRWPGAIDDVVFSLVVADALKLDASTRKGAGTLSGSHTPPAQ